MNVSTTKYYFALNFYKTANKSIKILQFIYISYILELSLHFIISKYCYYEKFYTSSQAHKLTSSQAHKLTSSQAHKLIGLSFLFYGS